MTNQDVVDFVRVKITELNGNLGAVCEAIMDYCLAPDCDMGSVGCDNMTVVIVALLRGQTKEQWTEAIAKRVAEAGLSVSIPAHAVQKSVGVVSYSESTAVEQVDN